ncbi:hypothetical protein PCE1_000391 [Barthelona sp. PCE]
MIATDPNEEEQTRYDELVEKILNFRNNAEAAHESLNQLKDEIEAIPGSLTQVPKALKFIKGHFKTLSDFCVAIKEEVDESNEFLLSLAAILSLLSMCLVEGESRTVLKFAKLACIDHLVEWGHAYIARLSHDISNEYEELYALDNESDELTVLIALITSIIPYFLENNAEVEVVDLCTRTNTLFLLEEFVERHNFRRLILYLSETAKHIPFPHDEALFVSCVNICLKFQEYERALRFALRIKNMETVYDILESVNDLPMQTQLAIILQRHGIGTETLDYFPKMLHFILKGDHLPVVLRRVAETLDLNEGRTPEYVYKSDHVDIGHVPKLRRTDDGFAPDSALSNRVDSIANMIINIGFGPDILNAPATGADKISWVHRQKGFGKTLAVAALGGLRRWNLDEALEVLPAYLMCPNPEFQGGAILGLGMAAAGSTDEFEVVRHVVEKYSDQQHHPIVIGSLLAIAFSYQTKGAALPPSLYAYIEEKLEDPHPDISGFAALTLGLVYAGHLNCDEYSILVAKYMAVVYEDFEKVADYKGTYFFPLALALFAYGAKDEVEDLMEQFAPEDDAPEAQHNFQRSTQFLIRGFAYVDTSDVVILQQIIHEILKEAEREVNIAKEKEAENPQEEEEEQPRGFDGLMRSMQRSKSEVKVHREPFDPMVSATLAIGMIGHREDISRQMLMRMSDHLLQFGSVRLKRCIPLLISLLSLGRPEVIALDKLHRLATDQDPDTCQAALMAMGLISCGTGNARVATTLKGLAEHFSGDPKYLMAAHMGQAFLNMGRTMVSVNVTHSERLLTNRNALLSLVTSLYCMGYYDAMFNSPMFSVMMFPFALAARPRVMATIDETATKDAEELQDLDMSVASMIVRVGQPVDNVAKAGSNLRSVTGFQTQKTPVLLSGIDRAELGDKAWKPYSSILEDLVVVRKVEEE